MHKTLFILMVAAVAGSLWASHAVAAEPEVRGTWLTTTGNDAISTPVKTAQTMRRLREIGLNTVYIECWKNGFTEFPSPTMAQLVGVPSKVNAAPPALQRDLLQECVIEAHRNGLLAIAWFEYGFMASYKTTQNPLRTLGEQQGWLLQDAAGELVGKQESFVWMNPLHPKPQEILLNIVLDAARAYDLDGVQLDDRIAMPTEMGYDPYTKALYAKDHAGKQPPVDPKDPEWIAWRAGRLTAFSRRFTAAVHQVNPRLLVSVSPAPYPWCYQNFACDWPLWMKWTGPEAWDECVPQNYRLDYDRTRQSIEEGFKVIGSRRANLLAGIRVVGDGPDMTAQDLTKTIQFTRDSGMAGHVLWFSRGVLDTYPNELRDFYDVAHHGEAANPARPADWRSPPIVAKQAGTDQWTYFVQQPGKFQPIAQIDGKWQVLPPVQAVAGDGTVACKAEAVELLPDRKP